VFEIDEMKAWRKVLISVTSYALGIFLISKAPWYLLPLAWAFTGTAATGVSIMCINQFFASSTDINYTLFCFPPRSFLF